MVKKRNLAVILSAILLLVAGPLWADSVEEINAKTQNALLYLKENVEGSEQLLRSAVGVLVFPDVVKIGFGQGGQYGEGVLLIEGEPQAYYATSGASYGLQLGAKFKSQVLVFLADDALGQFRTNRSWKVDVDAKVALLDGRNDSDPATLKQQHDIVAYIISDQGVMQDLTLDGTKISRLAR